MTEAQTIKGQKTTEIKATCPGKTHVLSGGLETNGGYGQLSHVGIPFDGKDKDKQPDDGWLIKATGLGSVDKQKVTANAVCSKLKPKYKTDKSSIGAGSEARIEIDCGSLTPVGGGVLGKVTTNSAYPDGGTWVTYGDNFTHANQRVETAAVCLDPTGVVTEDSDDVGLTQHGSVTSLDSCDTGMEMIGGGQHNSGTYGEVIERQGYATHRGGYLYTVDSFASVDRSTTAVTVCHARL